MNFTHSTSNKANPTQKAQHSHNNIYFIPFHVSFPVFWKLVFPSTSSCKLPLLHLAQCTRYHDPRVKLTRRFKCHMSTYTWLPHETMCCWKRENSPVNSGVFDRCKQSLAPVYTHLNYSPSSSRDFQLWVSIEKNVTGWLISSGSGASALCTQKMHAHSIVGTQRTS